MKFKNNISKEIVNSINFNPLEPGELKTFAEAHKLNPNIVFTSVRDEKKKETYYGVTDGENIDYLGDGKSIVMIDGKGKVHACNATRFANNYTEIVEKAA